MVVSLIRWPKPKSDAPRRDRWGHRIGDPHHNFLRSRQWQKIRLAFLAHHPLCEHCKLLGFTTAATTADHIVRLVDNDHFKRTSWTGLQALCTEHHNARLTGRGEKNLRNMRSEMRGPDYVKRAGRVRYPLASLLPFVPGLSLEEAPTKRTFGDDLTEDTEQDESF